MTNPRIKYTIRLPANLTRRLADHVRARRTSQTALVETALKSFLSPGGAERLEAALTRRLDHFSRQFHRAARNLGLSNERLALFIHFWLTSTAPLPDTAMKAAQAIGKERWERFIDSLTNGWRLGCGYEVGFSLLLPGVELTNSSHSLPVHLRVPDVVSHLGGRRQLWADPVPWPRARVAVPRFSRPPPV